MPDSPRRQSMDLGCPARGGIDPHGAVVRWQSRSGRSRDSPRTFSDAGPRADVPRFPSDDADSLKACCSAALWPYSRPPSASLVSREPSLSSARRLVSGLSLRASAKGLLSRPMWATVERMQRWVISRNDDAATSF